jgi:hypothetical protein
MYYYPKKLLNKANVCLSSALLIAAYSAYLYHLQHIL